LIINYIRLIDIYNHFYSFVNVFLYLYQNFTAVERRCLDCGDIIRGRSDKKFCSDQCRNNYNNRINRESNNYVRNVHGLLRKNRRILCDLYAEGKRVLHKDALFALGYNFNFFTHVIKTREGLSYHYCFEYGYREKDDEYVELAYNNHYLEYL